MEVQEFLADTDSDVMLEDSSAANDDNSTYLGSHENLPTIHDTALDLSTTIEEVGNIHEVLNKGLSEIDPPRAIFTPVHNLNPTDIMGG